MDTKTVAVTPVVDAVAVAVPSVVVAEPEPPVAVAVAAPPVAVAEPPRLHMSIFDWKTHWMDGVPKGKFPSKCGTCAEEYDLFHRRHMCVQCLEGGCTAPNLPRTMQWIKTMAVENGWNQPGGRHRGSTTTKTKGWLCERCHLGKIGQPFSSAMELRDNGYCPTGGIRPHDQRTLKVWVDGKLIIQRG